MIANVVPSLAGVPTDLDLHVLAQAARPRISFVTTFLLAQWVDLVPGPGEATAARGAGFSGTGTLAVPSAVNLGNNVTVEGPIADDQSAVRDQIADWGATCYMQPVDGPGAHEIRLPSGGVVRVRSGPPHRFTAREARLAAAFKPAAIVIGKDLDPEYMAQRVDLAVAEGVPCFVVVGPDTDPGLASRGGDVYLMLEPGRQLSDAVPPSRQLIDLRDETGAKAVVAFDLKFGLMACLQGTDDVLQLFPSVPLTNLGRDGSFDAFIGGFVSAFVRAPVAIRMERGMVAGMSLATRRALGLPVICGWSELSKFHKSHRGPAVRAIAPESLMSCADAGRDSVAPAAGEARAVRATEPQPGVSPGLEASHGR